jgi:anaerobic selenocysteine-containing dehydrogenase
MSDKARRNFLSNSAKLLAATASFTAVGAYASSHGNKEHTSSGNGLVLDASKKDICATCQFWGGMRKVSKDKKTVTAQSMGWCNNTNSMSYQKLTSADKVMKKTGIWKKWSAL